MPVRDTDIIFGALDAGPAARGLSAFGDASVTAVPTGVWNPSRWKMLSVGAWRTPGLAPVHILESAVAVEGLEHAVLSRGHAGCSILVFGDNMGELCATDTGR